MPRFDFGSPAAAMTGALQQALVQQEAKRRQAMIDELARQKQAQDAQMGMEKLSLDQQQLRLQQDTAKDDASWRAQQSAFQQQDAARRDQRARYVNVPGVGLVDTGEAGNPAPAVVTPTPDIGEVKDEGGYLWKRNSGTKDWVNAGPSRSLATQAGGGSPYYQMQTVYDQQGRPTAAIRFNARTGEAEMLPVPGGGYLKPPPGDLGKQSITNEVSMDALDNLMSLHEKVRARTGPVAGRLNNAIQDAPFLPADPEWADFAAATSAFQNAVIKAITGAQMSEPEAARIMRQIPQANDKEEVWDAKARQTAVNLAFLEGRLQNNRNLGGDTASPQGPQTPQGPGNAPTGGIHDLRSRYNY
jgi:hypothetical protein